jgi:hypothetical protein
MPPNWFPVFVNEFGRFVKQPYRAQGKSGYLLSMTSGLSGLRRERATLPSPRR